MLQQPIESDIQKLVQALRSSSSQDNLKAKEYLRTHADLVPRVIQGLQYLNRDKEVSYLQQEFGGGMPRANPQPVPGGGAYMPPQVRPQVPMHRMMVPQGSSNTMIHPGYGNAHMQPPRMTYQQGHPMGMPGHPHLQQMLQQHPQYLSAYGMQAPPPQYAMKQQQMRPSMNMYQQNMTMTHMMQQRIGVGGVRPITPLRPFNVRSLGMGGMA